MPNPSLEDRLDALERRVASLRWMPATILSWFAIGYAIAGIVRSLIDG